LIAQDILTVEMTDVGGPSRVVPRLWHYTANAVAFGSWLLGFYDSLLYWEEISGEFTQFVEILHLSHKLSIGKLFSLLSLDTRQQVLEKVQGTSSSAATNPTTSTLPTTSFSHEHSTMIPLIQCLEHGTLSYFGRIRSRRLYPNSLLWNALSKPKISIPDMAMVIPRGDVDSDDDSRLRSSRRTKRPKR
jgi:hypothetical protein